MSALVFGAPQAEPRPIHSTSQVSSHHTAMPHLTPSAKHHILLEYSPRSATRSFAALARRHAVKGGARTVQRWHQRWDRTARSLEHKSGTGRPRVLSSAQVSRHVRAPILAANRAHRAVHYTDLLESVKERQAKRSASRLCAATARRSAQPSRDTAKREQQTRVSTHAHETTSEHACVVIM